MVGRSEIGDLEAASSSTRGGGWAPSGWTSLWEYRAAQSRQACPEEAQGASWGAAKRGTLTMLLDLVVAVDEREKVEETKLRFALQHRAQRRARRLLEVVEEHHRAVGQRLLHEERWRQWRGGRALHEVRSRCGGRRRLRRRLRRCRRFSRRRALSEEGLPFCKFRHFGDRSPLHQCLLRLAPTLP